MSCKRFPNSPGFCASRGKNSPEKCVLFFLFHWTKYVFGSYGKEGGKKLYVTAGIAGEGNSALRINNPPEIVVIHLEKR